MQFTTTEEHVQLVERGEGAACERDFGAPQMARRREALLHETFVA
jgi:hypothetical protein